MPRDLLVPLESLAAQRPPDLALTREDLDAIIKLGRLLSNKTDVYEALPEESRQRMRAGAIRVVQAMVMLGWIEAGSL